jgi:hypothetical protein
MVTLYRSLGHLSSYHLSMMWDPQITLVIHGETQRLLLIIRILAPQNEPLWVPIIRKAKAHGFFHDRIRGIGGV